VCYRKVGLNILISIEHLSHVNNVPYCSPLLLLLKVDFILYLKFDFSYMKVINTFKLIYKITMNGGIVNQSVGAIGA
jgi:hypothetical protein